jgi:hypothetical protein
MFEAWGCSPPSWPGCPESLRFMFESIPFMDDIVQRADGGTAPAAQQKHGGGLVSSGQRWSVLVFGARKGAEGEKGKGQL